MPQRTAEAEAADNKVVDADGQTSKPQQRLQCNQLSSHSPPNHLYFSDSPCAACAAFVGLEKANRCEKCVQNDSRLASECVCVPVCVRVCLCVCQCVSKIIEFLILSAAQLECAHRTQHRLEHTHTHTH